MSWTEEELDLVSNFSGVGGYSYLTKRLGKSKNAIKLFCCRHGIRLSDNIYTSKLLGKELNRESRTVRKWRLLGWITGTKSTWGLNYGKVTYVYSEKQIVKFLRQYYFLFKGTVIPNPYFRNIVKECNNGFKGK